MMHLASLACFCVSAASTVKHYGMIPSEDAHNLIEEQNGAVSTIIEVIESNLCTEAGTGHPVPSCKTIVGFIKVSSGGFTGVEVGNYCPNFMSLFVKCKGSDAKAYAKNKKIEMTAFNSQKDYNCDKAGEKCIEMSV